jgi:nucleoside-diphosphate-sugar epimerase
MTAPSYLVTGGTGFLGSALVRRLVKDGARVRVLDDDSRGRTSRLDDIRDEIEFVAGDIRDADAVSKATKGVDTVCHLAFVNGTEFFYSKPDLVLDVGVRGMINVLDACMEHGVGDFFLASSSEVYQTPPVTPTDESAPLSIPDPLNPRYSYAGGKIISELMAVNYGRNNFDRVVIFRPHNVYGPDMGWEHVLPQFVGRMRDLAKSTDNPVPFPIQGDGQQSRSFVFIDDFIDGLKLMIDKGEHLSIYHIGTQEEVTMGDAAVLVAKYFEREIVLVPGPAPAGGTPRRCPDISKLKGLGYQPKVPISEGLPILARWYDDNADQAPAKEGEAA